VIVAGEVKSNTYVDVQETVRQVINKIGYTKAEYRFDGDSCGVLNAIHEQSPDINRGVDKADKMDQGAGDQGMMFGFATDETDNYMPLPLDLSHRILVELAAIRREQKEMTYLRPDSKSQVTIEYNDDHSPKRIHTIVVSTQHDEFDADEPMLAKIKKDVIEIFVSEAIIMGFIGTIIGLIVGAILITVLRNIYVGPPVGYFPISYEVQVFSISFFLGLLVTICAGYFPARKASKVDPVEIFRK